MSFRIICQKKIYILSYRIYVFFITAICAEMNFIKKNNSYILTSLLSVLHILYKYICWKLFICLFILHILFVGKRVKYCAYEYNKFCAVMVQLSQKRPNMCGVSHDKIWVKHVRAYLPNISRKVFGFSSDYKTYANSVSHTTTHIHI